MSMNRRSLLGAILGVPMMSVPALAALPKQSEWVRTTNKLGLPVTYTRSMAADLWSIHGIEAEYLLNNIYGTSFHIKKEFRPNMKKHLFKLYTNNKADGAFFWYDSLPHQRSFKNRNQTAIQTMNRHHRLAKAARV